MKKFAVGVVLILSILMISHSHHVYALSESTTMKVKKIAQCIYKEIPSWGYKVSGNFSMAPPYHPPFILCRHHHRPVIDFTITVNLSFYLHHFILINIHCTSFQFSFIVLIATFIDCGSTT